MTCWLREVRTSLLRWLSNHLPKRKNVRSLWLAAHITANQRPDTRVERLLCRSFRNSVRRLRADGEDAGGDFGLRGRHRAEGPERPGQAETTQRRLAASVLAAADCCGIFFTTVFQLETPPSSELSFIFILQMFFSSSVQSGGVLHKYSIELKKKKKQPFWMCSHAEMTIQPCRRQRTLRWTTMTRFEVLKVAKGFPLHDCTDHKNLVSVVVIREQSGRRLGDAWADGPKWRTLNLPRGCGAIICSWFNTRLGSPFFFLIVFFLFNLDDCKNVYLADNCHCLKYKVTLLNTAGIIQLSYWTDRQSTLWVVRAFCLVYTKYDKYHVFISGSSPEMVSVLNIKIQHPRESWLELLGSKVDGETHTHL